MDQKIWYQNSWIEKEQFFFKYQEDGSDGGRLLICTTSVGVLMSLATLGTYGKGMVQWDLFSWQRYQLIGSS